MMGDAQTSEHQLWVNLTSFGDGNLLSELPQLMRKMLEVQMEEESDDFDIILPSDDAWQAKIYYKLVERQREADSVEANMFEWMQEPSAPKLHDWNIRPKKKHPQCEPSPKPSKQFKKRIKGPGPVLWTVGDIAKAGRILSQPPLPAHFEDEQEMRRVYTLIYDVFRHKNVLTRALNDIDFFQVYPELERTISHVWLLLYDLYHRSFKKREPAITPLVQKLFEEAGLSKAEAVLWQLQTRLAASVARLRIEHNALSLSDLLPLHLRKDKITEFGATIPVTCWINVMKVKNVNELKGHIEAVFGLRPVEELGLLDSRNYILDKHCPHIIGFHGSMRSALAKSDMVKNHKLVVQDKSFCLGPATFVKHVSDLQLSGSVIQTHVNSPRTTAYLAAILSKNERVKKLIAFSAGRRKFEYEGYFQQLGMTNVMVFADKWIDMSPDAQYMEEVVAVYATPPNSYSAVNDPIDLVCSRGGDLSMLEILTEAEESEQGKERVSRILDEQRKTLRFAMSRPQIQFVLYETHSGIEAENQGMIQRTVKEVNKTAKLHHATIQGKVVVQIFPPLEGEPQEKTTDKLGVESDEKQFGNIKVPETDIFDVPELPKLCPSETSCIDFCKEGCFLALVQRKQVIKLDNKYMIQMAENRGLFGQTSSSSTRVKGSKTSRKKQEPPTNVRNKRKLKDMEVTRIAAPTFTFLRHSNNACDSEKCAKCKGEDEKNKTGTYRKWWSETTRHVMAMRSSLMRNKTVPGTKKSVINKLVYGHIKIDEVVARSRGEDQSKVPLFPKLRLTRERERVEKVQMQLPVTVVKFY